MPGIAELYVDTAARHIAKHVRQDTVHEISRSRVDFLVCQGLDLDKNLSLEYKLAFYNAILNSKTFDIFWLGQKAILKLPSSAIIPYIPDADLEEFDAPSSASTSNTESDEAATPSPTTQNFPSPDEDLKMLQPSYKRKRVASDRHVSFADTESLEHVISPFQPEAGSSNNDQANMPVADNTDDRTSSDADYSKRTAKKRQTTSRGGKGGHWLAGGRGGGGRRAMQAEQALLPQTATGTETMTENADNTSLSLLTTTKNTSLPRPTTTKIVRPGHRIPLELTAQLAASDVAQWTAYPGKTPGPRPQGFAALNLPTLAAPNVQAQGLLPQTATGTETTTKNADNISRPLPTPTKIVRLDYLTPSERASRRAADELIRLHYRNPSELAARLTANAIVDLTVSPYMTAGARPQGFAALNLPPPAALGVQAQGDRAVLCTDRTKLAMEGHATNKPADKDEARVAANAAAHLGFSGGKYAQ